MANVREQDAWVHMKDPEQALEIAKDTLRMSVARAAKLEELKPKEVKVGRRALIIGGGISGISAALDLGNSGFTVYLVEKSPTIGGRMAQLDKTFPTMDCSSCILTPKMVSVSRHPNVKLFTYAEVKDVQGFVGNFKVKILQRPKYVDEKKCTSCNECSKICPVEIPDEFNTNLSWRKAIYIPFPQAVPPSYVLDEANCLGLTPLACGKCKEVCEPDAIDYDQRPQEIELDVDTIIVATGHDPYNPSNDQEYNYGVFQNVVTSLETERMLNASGPTSGKVLRPSDLKEPQRVVYVQCVGSRNERTNLYCSRVCCMYAVKQARQLKEKHPETEVRVFYMDIRAFGKGFEEFYEKAAKDYGVLFTRGRVAEILEDPKSQNLIVRAEDTLLGTPLEIEADLVVLSVGIIPSMGANEIQKILKIPAGPDGFFSEAHPKLRPVDTVVDGVLIAGTAAGPKDIPDAVAQAKAAASGAASLMAPGVYVVEPYYATVDDTICGGCGTCVLLCPFRAVSIEDKRAKINEALCKGCGACAAACPAGAIKTNHFTDEQVMSQIEQAVAK
jgi:heterodisulfide reductase subunit A